jgi:hypothetical protein
MLALESIASNTQADAATRQGAREALRRENGIQDAPPPTEESLPRSEMAPAMSQSTAASFGLTGGAAPAPAEGAPEAPRKPTALETLVDVLNLPRALVAAGDLSGPLRQGIFFTVSHPTEWGGAFKEMFKALGSQEAADAVDQAIRSHPDFKLWEKLGGYTADINGKMGQREEAWISRFAQKFPLIKSTERAYVTFLNKLRFDVFTSVADDWRAKGVTDESSWRKLASYINAGTGRGDIKGLTDAGPILNAAFFSPRYLASRLQLPTYMLSKDPAIRDMAVKDFAKFFGAGAAILSLAALGGAQVELDPRSSDFGKVKIGDTRYDFWGGWQPLARYTAQLVSGESKSVSTGDIAHQDRLTTLGRFAQSKLSPLGGVVVNALRGETPTGDDFEASPSSVSANALALVTPLFFQDVADAVRSEGPAGALEAVPSAFGLGYQRYGGTVGGLDGLAADLAAKDPQRYPEGAKSFWDLEPSDRNAIKALHPDAYKRYQDAAQGDRAAAEQVRQSVETRQAGADAGLLSGQLTLDQWQSVSDDLKKEQLFKLQQVYANAPKRAPKTPLDRYYQAVDKLKNPATGQPDWNAVDEWVAQQPQTDQDYIARNTGLGGSPLQQLSRSLAKTYYAIPRYPGYTADQGARIDQIVTSAQSYSGAKTDAGRLAAVANVGQQLGITDARVLSAARMVILGRLKPSLQRQQYAKAHPELALLTGRGLPSPQALRAIAARVQDFA